MSNIEGIHIQPFNSISVLGRITLGEKGVLTNGCKIIRVFPIDLDFI